MANLDGAVPGNPVTNNKTTNKILCLLKLTRVYPYIGKYGRRISELLFLFISCSAYESLARLACDSIFTRFLWAFVCAPRSAFRKIRLFEMWKKNRIFFFLSFYK